MKQIAFFDFDGTITTKDTLLEFIKYAKGTSYFYLGFLIYSPFLVAYKLKIISNQMAKEKVLGFFFKNMALDAFESMCESFVKDKLPDLLRPKALAEIRQLKSQNIPVVIVSASPENWIRPWTKSLQIELIATCMKTKSGCMTGAIEGKNCHGHEKVKRIESLYTLSEYDKIYAYGDTSGDKPMLALAHNSFYKPFR